MLIFIVMLFAAFIYGVVIVFIVPFNYLSCGAYLCLLNIFLLSSQLFCFVHVHLNVLRANLH